MKHILKLFTRVSKNHQKLSIKCANELQNSSTRNSQTEFAIRLTIKRPTEREWKRNDDIIDRNELEKFQCLSQMSMNDFMSL